MTSGKADKIWPLGTAEGRWKGFGPYYAMFPVDFAREFISRYSEPGDTILDPYCGRGTSNYVAKILNRNSIGCDVNPVAWVYSKAKTDPARWPSKIYSRIDEIWEARIHGDFVPENEFQRYAWSNSVLSFLNCARRELNWRKSKIDWTLAAIILVYLHGKLGGGLSNQMRQSKSMAPNYAVNWWKDRNMRPPEIDPVQFLKERVEWRYDKGLIRNNCEAHIHLGDAREALLKKVSEPASLLITSPPYMGITNYQYDNWIRLWALGGPPLPNGDQSQRYGCKDKYRSMIEDVFAVSLSHLKSNAKIIVRTDRRKFTLETTAYAIEKIWPDHEIYGRNFLLSKPTQTALFGDKSIKPGEVDLLALPRDVKAPKGFLNLQTLDIAA